MPVALGPTEDRIADRPPMHHRLEQQARNGPKFEEWRTGALACVCSALIQRYLGSNKVQLFDLI